MSLKQITIKNFKALDDVTLDLADFNVLIGTNGSGKSSVLQALHWVFQSIRNKNAYFGQDGTARISEKNATYLPTPDYGNASYGGSYGNWYNSAQLDLNVIYQHLPTDQSDGRISSQMWIKLARNEGISVRAPLDPSLHKLIRDQNREFSTYIPGLAGIPLNEEKLSRKIIERMAAAGDANTVFRNMLLLLKNLPNENGENNLDLLQTYVSNVMGHFKIKLEYDDNSSQYIVASFQDEDISERFNWKPLELAGTGFLQVIQIFAYLIYFKPRLLLIDEPDAHLHPTAQEKLISVLAEAAKSFETQVILTTHSPSIVRSLPSEANLLFMEKGKLSTTDVSTIRQRMGWGLLDKRILLLTEDEITTQLNLILSQWPELARATAIWPIFGKNNTPPANMMDALHLLFGDSIKIVIHRDRDFLMPEEVAAIQKPYEDKHIKMWVTRNSDIESYWLEPAIIAAHFEIDMEQAQTLLNNAVNSVDKEKEKEEIRKKRNEIRGKIRDAREGRIAQFGDDEVIKEATKNGSQHIIKGKTLMERILNEAKNENLKNKKTFGQSIPLGLKDQIANDLKDILSQMLVASQTA